MRSVLVIGGSGFIGSNLIKKLIQKGESVTSFDLHHTDYPVEGVKYISGDFFDDENLERALDGIDAVYHCLSTVNPGNSNIRFMQGYARDFVQSVHLFDLCIKRGIKVIFLSSGGTIYGIQNEQPIREDAECKPINHYGSVKLCIESVMRTFNTQTHSNMLIARISNPYGPGQDFHKGVGFVDAAVKKTLSHEPIEIWGDGTVIRDYIYIDDVAEMLYALLDYNGKQEVFNISSNEGISLNQVIECLQKLGYTPKVQYKDSRSVDVPAVVLDNEKIRTVYTGPLTSFQEGMEKYTDYLQYNGWEQSQNQE